MRCPPTEEERVPASVTRAHSDSGPHEAVHDEKTERTLEWDGRLNEQPRTAQRHPGCEGEPQASHHPAMNGQPVAGPGEEGIKDERAEVQGADGGERVEEAKDE